LNSYGTTEAVPFPIAMLAPFVGSREILGFLPALL
jgi:hypothetical protein